MPSNPPRVSIITRTKDRPVLLRRALQSITRQSFHDWQLIVVNDGGDPHAVDSLLNHVAPNHRSRTEVISHDQPRGRWQAANAGVAAATGEFVILHDDDDTWAPEFLDRAVRYLDDHPERNGIVSRIEIIWEVRDGDSMVETGRERFLPDSVAPLLMDQQRFNQFVPIAFLYRRALHGTLGLYDETLPVVGDWVFNTRVLELGPLDYLSGPPTAFWHQRPSASGVDGNSVIADSDDHRRHDALLRDAQFRALVAREGSGGSLYFERRLRETEELIKREFTELRRDLTHPIRTLYRRLRHATPRNRK